MHVKVIYIKLLKECEVYIMCGKKKLRILR